jgi:hypothetical protein
MMLRLASGFAIPRRIDPDDIYQELQVTLWHLTQRVDPVNSPDDFRRLAKAELKNRCIDLTRHFRARKRLAVTGRGVHCQVCGAVTRVGLVDEVVCGSCRTYGTRDGDTPQLRWIDVHTQDVSLVGDQSDCDEHDGNGKAGLLPSWMADSRESDPVDDAAVHEVVVRLEARLDLFPDRALLEVLLRPPRGFIDLLLDYGYRVDPRKAPYWLVSEFLGVPEKDLRLAHTRIAVELVDLLKRYDYVDQLSVYNLRQIGFFEEYSNGNGVGGGVWSIVRVDAFHDLAPFVRDARAVFVDGARCTGRRVLMERLGAAHTGFVRYEPAAPLRPTNGLPGRLDPVQAYYWCLDVLRSLPPVVRFLVYRSPLSRGVWVPEAVERDRLEVWGQLLAAVPARLVLVQPEEAVHRSQIMSRGHGAELDAILHERTRIREFAGALPSGLVLWYGGA